MISEQEARAIAFLASHIRPHGARRWDEAGTYAAVMKLRDRRLADVVLAVVRAADDRQANTPNVILAPNSPHWRERDTGWQSPAQPYDHGNACGICDQSEARCKANPHAEHEYEPKPAVIAERVPDEHATELVTGLRDRLAKARRIDNEEQTA